MQKRERKLLRREISRKLNYMVNQESRENDFINSSQILTQRQEIYLNISRKLRTKDNRKCKRILPFSVEPTALPHINTAKTKRIFGNINEILDDPKTVDKLIEVHSFRPVTPFYINPNWTMEKGKVQNYSQHVGALLNTPKYIEYLKATNESSRSNRINRSKSQEKRITKKDSKLNKFERKLSHSQSSTARDVKSSLSSTSELLSSTTGSSFSSVSSSSATSLSSKKRNQLHDDRESDGTLENTNYEQLNNTNKSDITLENSNSTKTECSKRSSEKCYKKTDISESTHISSSRNPARLSKRISKTDALKTDPPIKKDKTLEESESVSSKSSRKSGSKRSITSTNLLKTKMNNKPKDSNENLQDDKQQKFTDECSDCTYSESFNRSNSENSQSEIRNSNDKESLNEDSDDDTLVDDKNEQSEIALVTNNFIDCHDDVDNKNITDKTKDLRRTEEKTKLLEKEEIRKVTTEEEQEKEVKDSDDTFFSRTGSDETSQMISASENSHIRFYEDVDEFLKYSILELEDLQIICRYFESFSKYYLTNFDYTSSYGKFLENNGSVQFINFRNITKKYENSTLTNEYLERINNLLKNHLEKKKQNLVVKDANRSREIDDPVNNVELTFARVFLKDAENNVLENFEIQIEEDKKTVEENKKSPENKSETIDDSEDFCDSFHRLFRTSICNMNKSDLYQLKKLVNEYQETNETSDNQTNMNTDADNRNSANEDDGDGDDLPEYFERLFQNSLSSINDNQMKTLNDMIERCENGNLEEINPDLISVETDEALKPFEEFLFKSQDNITKADLDKIKSMVNEYRTNSNSIVSIRNTNEEDNKSDCLSTDEENEVMMAFRNLFRTSIGNIKESDLKKINQIIENDKID